MNKLPPFQGRPGSSGSPSRAGMRSKNPYNETMTPTEFRNMYGRDPIQEPPTPPPGVSKIPNSDFQGRQVPTPQPQPPAGPKPQTTSSGLGLLSMQSFGITPKQTKHNEGFDYSRFWDALTAEVLATETPTSKLDFLRSALSLVNKYIADVPRQADGSIMLRSYGDYNWRPSKDLRPLIMEQITKLASQPLPPAWN